MFYVSQNFWFVKKWLLQYFQLIYALNYQMIKERWSYFLFCHHHQPGVPTTSVTPWVPPLLAAWDLFSICFKNCLSSSLPGFDIITMSLIINRLPSRLPAAINAIITLEMSTLSSISCECLDLLIDSIYLINKRN